VWYPWLVSQLVIRATTDTAERGPGGVGVGATGMWTFLATDAMGFAGLLIAYGILRVRADIWPDPRSRLALAPAAAVTFALLLSSLTMTLATRAPSVRARRGWLVATLALGAAFLAGAVIEYAHLLAAASPMGLTSDLFASTFYVVTGFHALHVLAGLIGVGFMLRAKYGAQAVETMGLYWHFVDAAWMPIFSFIYLWPAR
jgi:heme/copper-type cytochrome/quinol oxidase subunit 3